MTYPEHLGTTMESDQQKSIKGSTETYLINYKNINIVVFKKAMRFCKLLFMKHVDNKKQNYFKATQQKNIIKKFRSLVYQN